MKVIFLDFDGVVRLPAETGDAKSYRFDISKLKAVAGLATSIGARIVVSSSWREFYDLDRMIVEMSGILPRALFHNSWMTPLIYSRSRVDKYELPRGADILTWLYNHPAVTEFVILDDLAPDHFKGMEHHHIHCDSNTGITEKDIDAARILLQ